MFKYPFTCLYLAEILAEIEKNKFVKPTPIQVGMFYANAVQVQVIILF